MMCFDGGCGVGFVYNNKLVESYSGFIYYRDFNKGGALIRLTRSAEYLSKFVLLAS